MKAGPRFGPQALEELRQAIREAAGNEVLAIGRMDRKGRVVQIAVAARGSAEAVPALKPYLERGDVVIHNHPSGRISPSAADLRVASRLGDQGIGFYIVDNLVEAMYAVAEPVARRQCEPLAAEELAGALREGGRLQELLPDFEERESQVGMLRAVCRGFNQSLITAVEAGTGVGKSLAYLIPALQWVKSNGERVVVSTATINLQQQLIEKDIPLAVRLLKDAPPAALVVGRGNFLCRTRLREALEELPLFEEENRELEAIAQWARSTPTGNRGDLPAYPSDAVWSEVCSEADACHGLRCALREECFVLRSRREAAAARLLVVNHHLLFSDLALRLTATGFEASAVLPAFQHIVFDEAHHVERSATSFFSSSFSRFALAKFVSRLYRRRKNRSAGLLPALESLSGKGRRIRGARGALEGILDKALLLDRLASGILGEEPALRIDEKIMGLLAGPLQELKEAIGLCANLFEGIFEGIGAEEGEEEPAAVFESKIQLKRLSRVGELCERFLRGEQKAREVFWIESIGSGRGPKGGRFSVTPLEIGGLMRQAVYEPYRSILFTSATLTAGGSFLYWKSRVGLAKAPGREMAEELFPSPFDYQDRVLLGVTAEAPEPAEEGFPAFLSVLIQEALLISEGRALVLFTSHALLQTVFLRVREEMSRVGSSIPLLRQGMEDKSRLLSRFREETASVLFATDSFWEGIDAPGETLEVVILTRLPFRVPTEPVFQARMDALKGEGRDPFLELSLPDAVMRLRQGFGRLIRKREDFGVVLILDPRVVRRRYGGFFIESLPKTRRIFASNRAVLEAMENFIVRMRNASPQGGGGRI